MLGALLGSSTRDLPWHRNFLRKAAPLVSEESSRQPLLSTERINDVLVARLCGEGRTPWGSDLAEHLLNPEMVDALEHALDVVEGDLVMRCFLLTGQGRFFCTGLDLKWIEHHPAEAPAFQRRVEALLARLLSCPVPTVAGLNGHTVAVGAMLALAFDYRSMRSDQGFFVVPGIDFGIVYSPGMMALMRAKVAAPMQSELMVFGRRYVARELLEQHVVHQIAEGPPAVEARALQLAQTAAPKGQFRRLMRRAKKVLYKEAVHLLTDGFRPDMPLLGSKL